MTPDKQIRIMRTVIFFWLLGWFLKVHFFSHYLWHEIVVVPLRNDFFPFWLNQPEAAQFAYTLPIIAICVFFTKQRRILRVIPFLLCGSSIILNLHSDTHNDATFLTSFWVSLWLIWFAMHLDRNEEELDHQGQWLAQWIIGIIFLGGFVGKLTPEYWDGQQFYQLCVADKSGLVFWLQSHLSTQGLEWFYMIASRATILAELILALSPFFSFRMTARYAPLLMLGMALFRTWRIFSVLSCLVGLLIAFRKKGNSPLFAWPSTRSNR